MPIHKAPECRRRTLKDGPAIGACADKHRQQPYRKRVPGFSQ